PQSVLHLFFFYCVLLPRDLPSFPTRRSSDLESLGGRAGLDRARQPSARPPRRALPAALARARKDRARRAALARRRRREHGRHALDRKSTRLNSSHSQISYAVFCLKKKKQKTR